MSIRVMSRVWAHSQQKSGELLVMLALADFADDDGVCWPSIPVLAQKARLTERQVQYLLPKLEEAGELQIERSNGGRNRRNRYLITVKENGADISLKKLHRCKNNGEIHDTETVKPTSPASNRHRTVIYTTDPDFEAAWALYPKRAGNNPKRKAYKAWAARVGEGNDPAEMIAGVKRYAAFIRAVGNERTTYVLHAATFFGPDSHWREEWSPPQNGAERQRAAGGFVG